MQTKFDRNLFSVDVLALASSVAVIVVIIVVGGKKLGGYERLKG